jgi:transposase
MYNEDKISVLKLAKKFSVHRNTIYKVLNSKK